MVVVVGPVLVHSSPIQPESVRWVMVQLESKAWSSRHHGEHLVCEACDRPSRVFPGRTAGAMPSVGGPYIRWSSWRARPTPETPDIYSRQLHILPLVRLPGCSNMPTDRPIPGASTPGPT